MKGSLARFILSLLIAFGLSQCVSPLAVAAAGAAPVRRVPVEVLPGQPFAVTINFRAPVDQFNAIGLTESVPAGWTAAVEINGCVPSPMDAITAGEQVICVWAGPYNKGTEFTALYTLTPPAGVAPGLYHFPSGGLEYHAGRDVVREDMAGDTAVSVAAYAIPPAPATGTTAATGQPAIPVPPPVSPPVSAPVFTLSGFSVSPLEVNTGEPVVIRASVKNTGGSAGGYTVSARINGEIISTRELILAAGSGEDIVLKETRETPGRYEIDINGKTGVFTVRDKGAVASGETTVVKSVAETPAALTAVPNTDAPKPEIPLLVFIGGAVILSGVIVFFVLKRIFYW